ncbi:hypothetical protein ElyMa_001677800 [Elysia marginata]|uniref:Uncharacterized protein n=1 Tax=Elysia marginata TaxID=1093978 RepID=A0AAV4JTL3_9GAST|nr:hypothetical protein ElyMa_001677800 [Elysia marginata]
MPEGLDKFIEAKIEGKYALETGERYDECVKKLQVKLSEYPVFQFSSKHRPPTHTEIEMMERRRVRLKDLRFYHEPGKFCRWFPVTAKTDDMVRFGRDTLNLCIPDNAIHRVVMNYDECKQVIAQLDSVNEIRCGSTPDQHCLLQQPGKQACVVACCEMIARDNATQLPSYLFTEKNFVANNMIVCSYLNSCGLNAQSYSLPANPTYATFKAILESLSTSIILEFDGGLGSHVVILDKINNDFATIREPYHGMCVEIAFEYFCSQVGYKYFAVR